MQSIKTKLADFCCKCFCCLFVKPVEEPEQGRRGVAKARPRPIYRDDAFFLHSIHLLSLAPAAAPEVRSRRRSILSSHPDVPDSTSLGYHVSVTRMSSLDERTEDTWKGRWATRRWVVTTRNTLGILFNGKFFWYLTFYMIAIGMMANMAGTFIPFLFLVGETFSILSRSQF